jgi:hypothetical protein
MANITQTLMSNVQSKIDYTNLKDKSGNIVDYSFDVESFNDNPTLKDSIADSVTHIETKIDEAIAATINDAKQNGMKIDIEDYQISAAKKAATLALNASQAFAKIKAMDDAAPKGAITVDMTKFGLEDFKFADQIDVESFDGQEMSNSLYYSITQNIIGNRQDPFAELFFPTMVMDPKAAGVSITTDNIVKFNNFTRTLAGASEASKFEELPVIKNLRSNDIWDTDGNKIFPIYDATKNADVLVGDFKYGEKLFGEEITTAPIKIGVNANLLGMSQSDKLLAMGVLDNRDSLDRVVKLNNIYFKLVTKDSDGNDVIEYVKYNVNALPTAAFTRTLTGDSKDIQLDFGTDHIYLNTSNTLTTDDTPSAILAALGANYNIRLRVEMAGKGNVRGGNIRVHANVLEVVEVTSSTGEAIAPDSETMAAIKELFSGASIPMYTVEAYRTLSKMNIDGYHIGMRKKTFYYPVPFRTQGAMDKPLTQAFGNENDSSLMNGNIIVAGSIVSNHAVEALIDHVQRLRDATVNGTVENNEVLGISSDLVNTKYTRLEINVAETVDSLKASERLGDIRATIVNTLKDVILNVHKSSNYKLAIEKLNNGVKVKTNVIVGADSALVGYIADKDGKIDFGPDFEVHLESTDHELMTNKIIMSFGVFGNDRNKEPNPLNFGQCWKAPDIVLDVEKTENGGKVRKILNISKYIHAANLPIAIEADIINISGALSKVAVKMITA